MKRPNPVLLIVICFFPSLPRFAFSAETEERARFPGKAPRYAIVVRGSLLTEKGETDREWMNAVRSLKGKHSARIFEFEDPPHKDETLKAGLASFKPHYVCFVSRPRLCEANFIVSVTTLMRSLDDDPYDDAVWAVLTGYDASDAMRIVSAKPLEVKRHLSHVGGGWLEWFESGVSFSEGKQFDKRIKEKGEDPKKEKGPGDTTEEWVKEVNSGKVDLISTSGHATQKNWTMGYSYKSGRIVIAGGGKLAGVSRDGKRYEIESANPKIYFSPGNCLIAHVPKNLRDCMCLSWIRNGCNQFFGHVAPQTRWCTAWGIAHYFFALQNAHTFSEAVHLNRIASRYVTDIYKKGREKQLWNRCLLITVLYGDPAWEARMKRTVDPVYEMKLTVEDAGEGRKKISVTLDFLRKCAFSERYNKPPVALLPFFIADWKVERSDAKETVVADNFVMLDFIGREFAKGDTTGAVVTCRKVK